MSTSEPDLSVVLAVPEGSAIMEVVAALEEACEGISTELIVVRAGRMGPPPLPRLRFMNVRETQLPAETLTPVLWGAGFARARGRIVACTTDQLRVSSTWAEALVAGMRSGVAGVGGPIALATGADAATAAAYFLRFSLYTPDAWPHAGSARDIPGDNAAYRREDVVRHKDLLEEGFWEVEYHRRFERDGLVLEMVPGAVATFVGPVRVGGMLRQRFRHGREFGDSRVTRHRESRVRLLLSAPLVPLVLVARIGQRVHAGGRHGQRFVAALPWLFLLAVAWAAGEVAGAWRANTRRA